MLGRSGYPAAQVAACRAEFAALALTWRAVAGRSDAGARAEAEAQMFGQMVVALDGWFVHRLRGVEGKDGNALNEVRLLALGMTEHGGYFPSDHVIRWKPEASVTGYRAGDRIVLSEAVFSRLACVFLDGIAAKFPE
jgi:hypothetical protein